MAYLSKKCNCGLKEGAYHEGIWGDREQQGCACAVAKLGWELSAPAGSWRGACWASGGCGQGACCSARASAGQRRKESRQNEGMSPTCLEKSRLQPGEPVWGAVSLASSASRAWQWGDFVTQSFSPRPALLKTTWSVSTHLAQEEPGCGSSLSTFHPSPCAVSEGGSASGLFKPVFCAGSCKPAREVDEFQNLQQNH